MIQMGSPEREPGPEVFHAPGGFAWWYVDVITPSGDGLVLIWSLGLPFLPGYASAARRGTPQQPAQRPSINVALYQRGAAGFYLLQELPETDAEWRTPDAAAPAEQNGAAEHALSLGRSRFRSWTEQGRRRVQVELDCAVPGTRERLTGTVRLVGAARQPAPVAAGDATHLWTPLTGPAHATVHLRVGARVVAELQGRAYHDRNHGTVPLHDLGIHSWVWGRVPLRDRELVYYLLRPSGGAEPRCIGLEIDDTGVLHAAEGLQVEWADSRRTWGGLRWPERMRLHRNGEHWATVQHLPPVDSGPFYLRFQTFVTAGEQQERGWGELCRPARVDLARHRPLVRMRVHQAAGSNSPWLPLFTGPAHGRVQRWMCSLWGAA